MNNRKKWTIITILIIAIISLLLVFNLKQHYDHIEKQGQLKEKISVNNKNVNVYQNISYGKTFPNSKLDIIKPADIAQDSKLPVIFWMHGGGYIAGDKQYKNPLLAKIAEQGYIVVNINYALAPQYKYPTPLIQMNQAIDFIKENKLELPIDFDQVIIGGDSAGAQLASQYTAIQTNNSLRKQMDFPQQFEPSNIKGAILFGGFYNMQTVRKTEFPRIALFMKSYTGQNDWEHSFKNISQMSTVKQATRDYPPTYLSVGDIDPFASQNQEFSDKLKEEGVPVDTLFYDGSHHLHHQYQFHLNKPESKENIKDVLSFLSHNTTSSGVELNDQHHSNTTNNEVSLYPFD
ncbi:alpha/beta hydrolase [Staphylococcus simiae]|uniref:alpha/beta hydrolase n=1 Tax=Staphylococcus simiae TaxID=308354 RepID=UPI000B9491C3|nr:alpha/beta hydrolase [Staphylococcus simiae]PNZ12193.1 lipase [Staphylococcus simiae]SNV63421.1 putative esterase [Staphylococcus simiae]